MTLLHCDCDLHVKIRWTGNLSLKIVVYRDWAVMDTASVGSNGNGCRQPGHVRQLLLIDQ